MTLPEYIIAHTIRGECKCGQCMDVGNRPEPTGHMADLIFFKVSAKDSPDPEELKRLVLEHKEAFCNVSPFDGLEHNYMELGAWLGDQGLAMQFMGLCEILGLARILSPRMLGVDEASMLRIAGMGYLTIISKPG